MDVKRILGFLSGIAANNNRTWFQEHKAEYDWCKKDFEADIARFIAAIGIQDPSVVHLKPKDACYRFYRDVRFSPDKSPYKRHFGAYVCAKGKKSLHAGYYIHVQPGQCLISAGAYWLPTNILTSCRNEIMGNIDEWRRCVENGAFVHNFGYAGEGKWAEDESLSDKGFGFSHLKTAPKDFPRDYEFIDYLRMKDYACWHRVDDDFFEGEAWIPKAVRMLLTAKPMMDFTNSVIDDYE